MSLNRISLANRFKIQTNLFTQLAEPEGTLLALLVYLITVEPH